MTRRAGFSLVELMVVTAILSVVVAAVTMVLISSSRGQRTGVAVSDIHADGRRILDTLSDDLRRSIVAAGLPELDQNANGKDWTIRIAKVTGYDSLGLTFGTPIVYTVEIAPGEADNGADDDGDGLVDERRLVREDTDAGTSVVLTDQIRGDVAGGFAIAATGARTYQITVTLETTDAARRVVRRTFQTVVLVRN
jgi:prepilin-type N-terminal cleavage/methylation domain-containing protein